jgi:ferritin-like metal-binding protein YciE
MAPTQTRRRSRTATPDAPAPIIDTQDIAQLQAGRALLIQLLQEAHGAEAFAATTLQAHIAMTPASRYRSILERHLGETKDQAKRLEERLSELGVNRSLVAQGFGAASTVVGTALALTKGPIDAIRGKAGEEKLFKNLKDEVTTEAQEIVTYDGIEAAAHAVGDTRSAELAVSIRAQEQRAFDDLRAQVPVLAGAMVRSLVAGDSSFDLSRTGAAQTLRSVRDEAVDEAEDLRDDARSAGRAAAGRTRSTARKATTSARRTARGAERSAGRTARAASSSPSSSSASSSSSNGSEPIKGYDGLNAAEINTRLSGLSPAELRKVETYERNHAKRSTVLERIDALKSNA